MIHPVMIRQIPKKPQVLTQIRLRQAVLKQGQQCLRLLDTSSNHSNVFNNYMSDKRCPNFKEIYGTNTKIKHHYLLNETKPLS